MVSVGQTQKVYIVGKISPKQRRVKKEKWKKEKCKRLITPSGIRPCLLQTWIFAESIISSTKLTRKKECNSHKKKSVILVTQTLYFRVCYLTKALPGWRPRHLARKSYVNMNCFMLKNCFHFKIGIQCFVFNCLKHNIKLQEYGCCISSSVFMWVATPLSL